MLLSDEVLLSDDCSDDSASVSERGIARGDTPGDIPVRLKMDTCNKLGFSVGVEAKVECRTTSFLSPSILLVLRVSLLGSFPSIGLRIPLPSGVR